jgi:hypothetical protein
LNVSDTSLIWETTVSSVDEVREWVQEDKDWGARAPNMKKTKRVIFDRAAIP